MEERYTIKIQAAFVEQNASGTPGYHFWRLIKQYSAQDNDDKIEVLSVLEPSLEISTKKHVSVPLWRVVPDWSSAPTFQGKMPSNTAIVYENKVEPTDAQQKWDQAVRYLYQASYQFCFDHYGVLNAQLKCEMQNFIYHLLAGQMGIQPFSFIESSLFQNHITAHKLLGIPQRLSNTDSSTQFTYKIVAAVTPTLLKTSMPYIIDRKAFPKRIMPKFNGDHFWMLICNDGKSDIAIEQVYGLPTHNTNGIEEIIPINVLNNRKAFLKIHCLSPQKNDYWVEPAKTTIVYEAKDALSIWRQMKNCIAILNYENVPYSALSVGMSILRKQASNSNSAYASIGFILKEITELSNFKIPEFDGFFAPGIKNPILPEDAVQDYFKKISNSATDTAFLQSKLQ